MADVNVSNSSSGWSRRAAVPLQILALVVFWCLFSGKFDVVHLSYGALSIALVMVLTRHLRLAASVAAENELLRGVNWPRALSYPFWLLWQIVLANVGMTMIILGPRKSIDPVLLRFEFPVEDDVARVTLGNSITLTPGTFTLRVRGPQFVVHSINRKMSEGLLDNSMQRHVARVFGEELPPTVDVKLDDHFVPADREAD